MNRRRQLLVVLELLLGLAQVGDRLGYGEVRRCIADIGHDALRRPLVRAAHEILHTQPRSAEAHRHKQPHEHQRPERVLQPRAKSAPQHAPEQHHGEYER